MVKNIHTRIILSAFLLCIFISTFASAQQTQTNQIRGVVIPASIPTININGTISGSAFNETYNNILNQSCQLGNYTYGIQTNGSLLCRSDVSGSGGGISAISGDLYITNTSGSSPTIRFNETQNNITISSIASQFNSTDFLLAIIQGNNASWLSTFNASYDSKVSYNITFNQTLTDLLYSPIKWDYNQTQPAIDFTNTLVANTNASWLSIFNSSYIVRTGDDGISGNFTINNGNFTINNGSLFFPLPATGACDIIFQITGRAMRFCRLNAAGSILTAEFTSNISNSFSQITMGVGSANRGDIFAGNGSATTDAYINSSVTNRVMAWNNFFPVLKPTNTPPACISATEGLLFQNATSHTTCVCNSTTYNIVGSATRC